ncbi:MAG: PEP-CTERM sorting domain-containing protein [Okeania sp. SIO3H1]|nr:PEP-CTERM sorting domain-containing protein [Okeania sp. SIO3H1]
MKTHQKYIFSLLATTAMLGAGSAQAAPIVIDDFSVGQDVGFQPIPTFIPSNSQVGPDGSILGGFRDMEVMGDADGLIETRMQATGGVLNFSNNVETNGTGMIVWDGDDDPTVVDEDGLGGIDLTGGVWPLDRILVEIISADLPGLELEFTIYDLDSNVSTLSQTFAQAITTPETATFLFDDFSGTADFTNVGAIKLEIDGPPEIDAQFDMIKVEKRRVPEPLTSLWTLAGVSALGGLSVKKKSLQQ